MFLSSTIPHKIGKKGRGEKQPSANMENLKLYGFFFFSCLAVLWKHSVKRKQQQNSMIKELLYLTSRRKNSVSFPPDVQQLLDAALSCLLCPEKGQGRGSDLSFRSLDRGVGQHTEPLDTLPLSREGGHQATQEHSRCWTVQHLPLLSLLPWKLRVPWAWAVPHPDWMAFILSRGWLWVHKTRKIIKFCGQHPAPNWNFLVKHLKGWQK